MKDYVEASKILNRLLEENPGGSMALSHYFLARTEFLAAWKKQKPLPPDTVAHLEQGLKGLGKSPIVYLDAACIYMHKPGSTSDEQKALDNLRLAIKHGASKVALDNVGPMLGELPLRLSDEEREHLASQPQQGLVYTFYYEPGADLALPLQQLAVAAR